MADRKFGDVTGEAVQDVQVADTVAVEVARLAEQIALIVAHLNHASLSEQVKAV